MGRTIVIGVVVAAVIVVVIVVLARREKTGSPSQVTATNRAEESDSKFISIVLLLKQPKRVSQDDFKAACERAFGSPVAAGDIVKPPGQVEGFIVRKGSSALGLIISKEPYVKDRGAAAEQIRLFELKKIMQDHVGWVSVDFFGDLPVGGKRQAYEWVGKLVAEFLDDDCLGIYSVETQKLNVVRPNTVALLRGPKQHLAFEYDNPDEVVEVKAGDTEIKAAEAEARRRWPEFVAAFERKRPMQGFAVKIPMKTSTGSFEHIWIEILTIKGQMIVGRLANEPNDIPGKKIGDAVSVTADQVEDWMFEDKGQMLGGFTAKVLQKRLHHE